MSFLTQLIILIQLNFAKMYVKGFSFMILFKAKFSFNFQSNQFKFGRFWLI